MDRHPVLHRGRARVAQRTGVGTTHWTDLVTDQQGSITPAVDHATGQVTRRRYLPFGAPRDTASLGVDRGFLGQLEDPTGLDDLTNRGYDPALGRFIAPDPLSLATDPETLNPYSYARNNPETYSDPSGLTGINCPMPDGLGCAGAAGHSHPGTVKVAPRPGTSGSAASAQASSDQDQSSGGGGILGKIRHGLASVAKGTANFTVSVGVGAADVVANTAPSGSTTPTSVTAPSTAPPPHAPQAGSPGRSVSA